MCYTASMVRSRKHPADPVRARLEREIIAAKRKRDTPINGRHELDYSTFAFNLDAGIDQKRDFALRWRQHVIDIAGKGVITERTVKVWRHGDLDVINRSYRVFAVDGVEMYAVCPACGPNSLDREIFMALRTQTIEAYLRAEDWHIGTR